MKFTNSRIAFLATTVLLGLFLLLPGWANAQVIDDCADAPGEASCAVDFDADTGNSGDTGPTGDGGTGGGGGRSGNVSAGDAVGGNAGFGGPGGSGGGNGGNGGGGGPAGGSGNYSGATVESSSPGGSLVPAPRPQVVAAKPSAHSSGVAYGGGGGPAATSARGASAGGSGGTFCEECSIILGSADMVNVGSLNVEPRTPTKPISQSPSGDNKERSPYAGIIAAVAAVMLAPKLFFALRSRRAALSR